MRIIHSDERAVINTVAAVLDGVTYPLAAIASLETREIKPKIGCAPIVCYFFGGPIFLLAVLMAPLAVKDHDPDTIRSAMGFAVLGGSLLIGGIIMGFGAPTYALVISTSAGERVALVAPDRGYVEYLRRALELALVESTGRNTESGSNAPR